jgi:glycosyltransferase involved in cell wall biosynthesis
LREYQIAVKDNEKIFFALGRLNDVGLIQKGMEDLIYAIFLIKNNREVFENIKVILVGKGERKDYIVRLTENLGINGKFVFIDEMPHEDVLNFIEVSDCVVLLSRFEGLSMFALEALSCGSVLLFARSGGIRDLVQDGLNGYLVDSQNIEMIEEKIIKIALKDSDEIIKMKRESLKCFNDSFSPSESANKFMKIANLIKNI